MEQHLVEANTNDIISDLQRLKYDRPGGAIHIAADSIWLKGAMKELQVYLTLLSGTELSARNIFPRKEFGELQTTVEEMVSNIYPSQAEIPCLKKLSTQECAQRIKSIRKMGSPHALPCAKVLVNIELDELGEVLHVAALGRKRESVQTYVEFAQRSGWGILRDYLLHAITFNWTKKKSTAQYGVIGELNQESDNAQRSPITVLTLWERLLSDRTSKSYLNNAIKDYMKGGGEAFPQISQEYVNPTYSWDHKQLSVRKRMVYGYRS